MWGAAIRNDLGKVFTLKTPVGRRTELTQVKAPSNSVATIVGGGCARNVPAELVYEAPSGEIITGRVRLLQLTDRQVLADRPAYLEGNGRIPRGVGISIHIQIRGTRYEFKSAIEESYRIIPLNARQNVPGIALSRPDVVIESQRRTQLRVSVVGYDPLNVRMVRPHPTLPDCCPVTADLINGWLIDVSGGGMAVLVDHRVLGAVPRGELFFLSFVLPDVEDEFFMLGSVRHTRTIASSGSLRLGIGLRPWNGTHFKHDQQRISRFVARHQRRMLRRRR